MLRPTLPVDDTRKRAPTFDDKRLHLLAAAARVFAEVGYDRASMRRVAAEAQVSLAGIYHYVAGKEELLYWIQLHTFEALLQGLERCIAEMDDPRERLGAAVRNHIRHFGEHMHELKVCARELETLEGEAYDTVNDRRRAYFRAFHVIIKELQPGRGGAEAAPDGSEPGREGDRSSWLATANLFGMLNWFYQWYDAERTQVELDDLADQQAALFLNGYLAAAGTADRGGNA